MCIQSRQGEWKGTRIFVPVPLKIAPVPRSGALDTSWLLLMDLQLDIMPEIGFFIWSSGASFDFNMCFRLAHEHYRHPRHW